MAKTRQSIAVTPELREDMQQAVRAALREDRCRQDLSSAGLENKHGRATVKSRGNGVLAGRPWFDEVYAQIDERVVVDWHLDEGGAVRAGGRLCSLAGPVQSLLRGERCALNFLQLLSGVASRTARYAAQAGGQAAIKDTRKTIPGLRLAQKYAVRCGGGENHRFSLADAVLIKENNAAAYGSIRKAVEALRKHHPNKSIEVEAEDLRQVKEALAAKADAVLLDNFTPREAEAAVKIIGRQAAVEISGGVTLDNLKDYAALKVSCLSVGDLTKNLESLDLSMRIEADG